MQVARQRARGYTPGAPVCKKGVSWTFNRDISDIIVQHLKDSPVRKALVLRLVNKQWAKCVWESYLFWRHQYLRLNVVILPTDRVAAIGLRTPWGWTRASSPHGISFNIRPLPNFMIKPVPRFMRNWVANGVREEEKDKFLAYSRAILVLQNQSACSLCRSKRHTLKKMWSINKSLCRFCIQDNFLSHKVLEQEYGVYIGKPLDHYKEFLRPSALPMWGSSEHTVVHHIQGRVMYFSQVCTQTVRIQFTDSPHDFKGYSPELFFFWRPHIEKIFDLPALRFHATALAASARALQSVVRQAATRKRYALQLRKRCDMRLWVELTHRRDRKRDGTEDRRRLLTERGKENLRALLLCNVDRIQTQPHH
jgi:hypothetical protein